METAYVPNNAGYSDIWRTSPGKPTSADMCRTPLELNVSSYPTSLEMEPITNVFTFSPCASGYK